MNYLATARSVVTGDERNESDEESALLNPEAVEQLRAAIVDAATVELARFDRAAFESLWEQWKAHDAHDRATEDNS